MLSSSQPCAPRFFSRRAAASSSASVVPEVLFLYWQRVRIPCDTIDTRGLLDFLRVTGNCFWFLDVPPVWKGLVCSPMQSPCAPRFLSRRAAAFSSASVVPEVLFLHWQRVRIPCDTIDTRGLLDFETFYPTDPTDRPTNRKSAKKLSDFRKSLHVQSRVLVKCDF